MRFRRKQEEGEGPAVEETPDPRPQTPTSPSYDTPLSAQAASEGHDEHPEVIVGAAFVGGLALAQILKRFGR